MTKVFAVSDIHSDCPANMAWVESHCESHDRPNDVVIIAGDVSDSLEVLRITLTLFKAAYGQVFFTIGNHELWVRRTDKGRYSSIQKLALIERLCAELEVITAPTRLECGIWIVPIMAWYHAEWDEEPDVPDQLPIEEVMMDFHSCVWPASAGLKTSDNSLARYFDDMNDPDFREQLELIAAERNSARDSRIQAARSGNFGALVSAPVVISFSHFIPFQSLLPEKRYLHFPNLAKAVGSSYLGARVTNLSPDIHIFGHTHFTQDQVRGGTRFIQWPIGNPGEQRRRGGGGVGSRDPLLVWDSEARGHVPRVPGAYWSDFYRRNTRRPELVVKHDYGNNLTVID